ncbi:MAG: hypothetical protein AAF532_12390 [Planctomycetota bacterium]
MGHTLMPPRTRCATRILAAAILILTEAAGTSDAAEPPASSVPLDAKIDLEATLPIPKALYGANAEILVNRVWFDHPALEEKYIYSGRPFFRFPGGTPSNYYNHETGFVDLDPRSAKATAFLWVNQMITSQTGDAGRDYDDFFAFAQKTDATYSIVLNVCTKTAAENRVWLRSLAAKGYDVTHVEIGNEVYLKNCMWVFPTGDEYVRRAQQETASVRKYFPDAKVGVVVPTQLYKDARFFNEDYPRHLAHERGWIEALQRENFFDAVVLHPYTNTGVPYLGDPKDFISHLEGYKNVTNNLEQQHDAAFDQLETRFPGKEIWATEYGVGGFGGTVKHYRLRFTHLGALHADLMLVRFLNRPSVTVAHWHSFSHFFDIVGGEQGIGDKEHPGFAHFRLFDDPIRQNDSVVPLAFGRKNPDVEAVALVGDERGHLVLINKRGRPHTLRSLTASRSGRTLDATFRHATQLRLRSDMTFEEATYSEESPDRVELSGDELTPLELAPYSATKLEFTLAR